MYSMNIVHTMGQYYLAAFLAENDGKEFIRAAINSHEFANGAKLTEHSYVGNNFVSAIEYLLSNLGMFYKTRLVWAGDYADPEPNSDNLYTIAQGKEFIPSLPTSYNDIMKDYSFIVNHTKKQYMSKKGKVYHPLPLLTAEGNGRGGGDYRGPGEDMIGIWARDVISMEIDAPADYTELRCEFSD